MAPPVEVDYFDSLPDDIVLTVLSKLSSSVNRPQDLFSAFLTYGRCDFGLKIGTFVDLEGKNLSFGD